LFTRPLFAVETKALMAATAVDSAEETATLDPSSAATKFKMYVQWLKPEIAEVILIDMCGCVG
jgi:hypothetical protein